MGTRGLWGFVIDGEEKLAYNHWDSYPSGLGAALLEWIKVTDLQKVVDGARNLRLVKNDEDQPPAEEIQRLNVFADPGVGGPMDNTEVRTWYQLLRKTQGDPISTLIAGVMIDASDFATDSLFCEWGYVFDFDRAVFQVYKGFITEPHTEGRFADRQKEVTHRTTGNQYYPIKLVAEWSLERLPTIEEFEQKADPQDDDEDL